MSVWLDGALVDGQEKAASAGGGGGVGTVSAGV